MARILNEGNLQFDFNNCPLVSDPVKFDTKAPYGIMSVDFVAETEDFLYFIEIKDFQNPHAPKEQRKADYEMLIAAGKGKAALSDDDLSKGAMFTLKIGQKIKDSLLRKYALGEAITKNIVYLVFINLDSLGTIERGRLKERISGHIPTGLNNNEYSAFSSITFDIVNAEQLKKTYYITCTAKMQTEGGQS